MIDFRILGREALIIEYTDIVSLVGYNIINYLKDNHINNDMIQRMSKEDILLSYVNRLDFDISSWIKDTFDLECNIQDYIDSDIAFKPNNAYAFKMFPAASKENIKNLYIYSETFSPSINKYIKAFNTPDLKYVYGDIIPILNQHPNSTYTTSNPNNIRKCIDVSAPMLLTVVDDFVYVADIVKTNISDKLRGSNKILMYTSISNG